VYSIKGIVRLQQPFCRASRAAMWNPVADWDGIGGSWSALPWLNRKRRTKNSL